MRITPAMRRGRFLAAVAAVVLAGLLAPLAAALEGMPTAAVTVGEARFTVHLAATAEQRALGFQHVPAEAMADTAIYFRYAEAARPVFHMRNVAAPLRIAWVGPERRVLGVTHMRPGGSGYRPPGPIIGALEFVPQHPLADAVRPGATVRLAPCGEASPCPER